MYPKCWPTPNVHLTDGQSSCNNATIAQRSIAENAVSYLATNHIISDLTEQQAHYVGIKIPSPAQEQQQSVQLDWLVIED